MSRIDISLPYGSETRSFSMQSENLIGVYSPKDIAAVPDVHAEVLRSINHPIGAKPLRELVKGAVKVAIVADDNTRLTPTDKIIPVILDEMNAAGIRDDQVVLVIALGTHRFMTDKEIIEKFGHEVVKRIKIRNHPFKDPDALIDLGVTPDGTKVEVNREVYEADFKIGIGSIVPHHIPGYAGGAKIVQPGISGEQTTADTHLLSVRAPRSYLGVEDNPVRSELNRIARQINMHTIINTVLNRHGEVVGAFFGDIVEAFNEGVKLAKAVYSVEIPEEADVVVSSSHPCDLEFWQAHKTLYPSDLAVKAGGIIIVVTPCYEGVAKTHCDILEVTGHSSDHIRKLVSSGQLHDEVGAALAIAWSQVKEREQVFIVSDGICREEAEKLGFKYFGSVQAAVDAAIQEKGKAARVTVLTHAPDMLPVLPVKQYFCV